MSQESRIAELEETVAKLKAERKASFFYTHPRQGKLEAEYGLTFDTSGPQCRLSIQMELGVTNYAVEALAFVERELTPTLDKLRELASDHGGAVHEISCSLVGDDRTLVTRGELDDIEKQKAAGEGRYKLPARLIKKSN